MADKNLGMTSGVWAPICTPKRGRPYVLWPYVRPTRRGAREAYLEQVRPEWQKRYLEGVRFARVTITEDCAPVGAKGGV